MYKHVFNILKGNCTARNAYDFSLQNDRAQKVLNLKNTRRSKACLEPKLWHFLCFHDDVIICQTSKKWWVFPIFFTLNWKYEINSFRLNTPWNFLNICTWIEKWTWISYHNFDKMYTKYQKWPCMTSLYPKFG